MRTFSIKSAYSTTLTDYDSISSTTYMSLATLFVPFVPRIGIECWIDGKLNLSAETMAKSSLGIISLLSS